MPEESAGLEGGRRAGVGEQVGRKLCIPWKPHTTFSQVIKLIKKLIFNYFKGQVINMDLFLIFYLLKSRLVGDHQTAHLAMKYLSR